MDIQGTDGSFEHMRIVMITGSFPPQHCGVGAFSEGLVRELRTRGLDVEVVATASAEPRINDSVAHEVSRWTIRNWLRATTWIAMRTPDVVHIQYPAKYYGYRPSLALLSAILRLRVPHTPIVVTVHEFSITHVLRRLTVGSIAMFADSVVLTAVSERMALGRFAPWLRRKFRVVPVAAPISRISVTPAERNAVRSSLGIAEEDIVVVYFGFLHPNKGVENLFRAFALACSSEPRLKLVMLSQFDPSGNHYHADMERLVEALGVRKCVFWPGFLSAEDVSRHLGSADIGFFPFQDGVSLRRTSFILAMSHNLPTVTTEAKTPAVSLGLVDGENIVLSPDHSAASLAAALLDLARSGRSRRQIGSAAGVWAEPFDWSVIGSQTIDVYRSVLSSAEASSDTVQSSQVRRKL
jgi:glycosyltransferase involved in cell wall biosynthesis